MALLSELVRIVAEVEGLDEVSVGIFARHARECGLIAQGGRGRSAAKMTAKDAANLLIAVNGCNLAKEVGEQVPIFREMPAALAVGRELTKSGLGQSNFGSDLEVIIGLMAKYTYVEMPGEIFIRFFRPYNRVEVMAYPIVSGSANEERIKYKFSKNEAPRPIPDRSVETVISHVTLRAIAIALTE